MDTKRRTAMKKIFAMSLVFCLVFGMISNTGVLFASENMVGVASDWNFIRVSDGICITGYQGNDNPFCIPDEIEEEPVVEIAANAFFENSSRGELRLPSGLKRIGNQAFRDCKFMKGVSFPETLEKIGDGAFEGCTMLTGDLRIPDQVTELGNAAFASCENLKGKLILPENLKMIKANTFYRCGFTGELVLPEKLEFIGSSAFFSNTGLKDPLVIPESVEIIEFTAFQSCLSISKIVVSGKDTLLGTQCFETVYANVPIIYCQEGSTASEYAKQNGYSYKYFEEVSEVLAELHATPKPEVTVAPTEKPTAEPTVAPTEKPTAEPTVAPTEKPTAEPTVAPTEKPTAEPTVAPTERPTAEPTVAPTEKPTAKPTIAPTEEPTVVPTQMPTTPPVVTPIPVDIHMNIIINIEVHVTGEKNGFSWDFEQKASQYEIYRSKKKNGEYKKIKTLDALSNSFSDSKAGYKTTYYYKVCAKTVDEAGNEKNEFSKPVKLRRFTPNAPIVKAKKNKKKHILELSLSKREGKQIEIYAVNGNKKVKINLASNRLKKNYKLMYRDSKKKIKLKIRTKEKIEGKWYYSDYVSVKA